MKNNSIVIDRSISHSFLDMYGSIAEAKEKIKKVEGCKASVKYTNGERIMQVCCKK
jgi:hypothetical protein